MDSPYPAQVLEAVLVSVVDSQLELELLPPFRAVPLAWDQVDLEPATRLVRQRQPALLVSSRSSLVVSLRSSVQSLARTERGMISGRLDSQESSVEGRTLDPLRDPRLTLDPRAARPTS